MAATSRRRDNSQSSFQIYPQSPLLNSKHRILSSRHVDEGESEFETALRETHEEAGFTREQLVIVEGFKSVLNYEVRGKPKRVVYWLAELAGQTEVKLSNEHTEYKWLELKEALEFAKYEDMKKSLTEADEFINSNLSS